MCSVRNGIAQKNQQVSNYICSYASQCVFLFWLRLARDHYIYRLRLERSNQFDVAKRKRIIFLHVTYKVAGSRTRKRERIRLEVFAYSSVNGVKCKKNIFLRYQLEQSDKYQCTIMLASTRIAPSTKNLFFRTHQYCVFTNTVFKLD